MSDPISLTFEGTRVLEEPPVIPKSTGLRNLEILRDGVQPHEDCKPPPILDIVFGGTKCLKVNSVSLHLIFSPYPGVLASLSNVVTSWWAALRRLRSFGMMIETRVGQGDGVSHQK
jgi:hypothetical protein